MAGRLQAPGAGVCPRCAEWAEPWTIDARASAVSCPHCGYSAPFLRLPLFLITGASGSGKTMLGEHLVVELRAESVVLDRDLLWHERFRERLDEFNRMWLRLTRQVAQSGQPLVLYGTALPEQIERLGERAYFSAVHYLALACSEEDLVARLHARPAWRGASSAEFLDRMRTFNAWLKENAAKTKPPMTLLDTSELSTEASVAFAASWVRARLACS